MRGEDFPGTPRGEARLVPKQGYWAFYPSTLPRTIDYSDELVRLLDEATGALHRLAGVGRLLPNPHLLMAPYVRLEAVLSSRIEGTLSDVTDLLRLEAGDEEGVAELRDDVEEVRNYITALTHGIERLSKGFPLSLRLLREIHERLMTGVRGAHATPGEFRRSPNWIGGSSPSDATFVPPPVDAMHGSLDDFERFLHEDRLPLLIHLALAHYQFEVIHPFVDGNGRIGRLMVPLLLVERGVLSQPLLYLSAYLERNRTQYYDLLLHVSRTGELPPWISFFLRAVRTQAADAADRTIRLVELQERVRAELLADRAPITTVRTAELLFSTPYVSATSLARQLDVTFPTAQTAIDRLLERGELMETTGRKRNRFYFAQRIFDAVYGPLEVPDDEQPRLFDS